MHSRETVVTIRDARTGRTHREYDHIKTTATGGYNASSVRVVLPIGSEYELAFKVMDYKRRRAEITIDGQPYGTDMILSPGESVLERFFNSDRRFKVLAAGDAGVADPTSRDNGVIRITLYREQTPQPKPRGIMRFSDQSLLGGGTLGNGWVADQTIYTSCQVNAVGCPGENVVGLSSFGGAGAPVATGEGSKSNQTFSSTGWAGDEIGYREEFTFTLQGSQATQAGFCHKCGYELLPEAGFCHKCGTKVG